MLNIRAGKQTIMLSGVKVDYYGTLLHFLKLQTSIPLMENTNCSALGKGNVSRN